MFLMSLQMSLKLLQSAAAMKISKENEEANLEKVNKPVMAESFKLKMFPSLPR